MKVTHIDVADIMNGRTLVITVNFRNITKLRIWLSGKLFILAARVGGFGGIEIEDVSDA